MRSFLALAQSAIIASALVVSLTPCNALSFALGPYVVFFEPGSARLDDEDKKTLDVVVSGWSEYRFAVANVNGHADRTGPPGRHPRLSCARAIAVRNYLIARGLPENRIKVLGWGVERPLVETAEGLAE